jgi:2-keto-4-pentenoate hydratase/2-oxohepta-3-ene-1,7-dioic acid hydratase in catechol pathway
MKPAILPLASNLAMALAAAVGLAGCAEAPTTSSFEPEALQMRTAPLQQALTLAVVATRETSPTQPAPGRVVLVTSLQADRLQGIPLDTVGHEAVTDPIDAAVVWDDPSFATWSADRRLWQSFEPSSLRSPAGSGTRHVASGGNFPDHAEETSLDSVFSFPKFGPATPARTTVGLEPGELLDYEVEICMRMDRAVASMEDFGTATKGFFLCGDFTDRAELVRKVRITDIESGIGFSDAKSGLDDFPTGSVLVIPRDWRAFVAEERIVTWVNGRQRQDARGREMILDFERLVQRTLSQRGELRYEYQGQAVTLVDGQAIGRGVVLMSGTPEGVLFRSPSSTEIAAGVWRFITQGWWLGEGPARSLAEAYVERHVAQRSFLQAGDVVRYGSSRMGDSTITVTPSPSRTASQQP